MNPHPKLVKLEAITNSACECVSAGEAEVKVWTLYAGEGDIMTRTFDMMSSISEARHRLMSKRISRARCTLVSFGLPDFDFDGVLFGICFVGGVGMFVYLMLFPVRWPTFEACEMDVDFVFLDPGWGLNVLIMTTRRNKTTVRSPSHTMTTLLTW